MSNSSESRVRQLTEQITKYNKSYRTGEAEISDQEFDILIEELQNLDPDNSLLGEIGYIAEDDSRKQPLPIPMASMNKIKNIDDYHKWLKSKSIPTHTMMVLTPKYDGLSFCVDESNGDAWSRGDGKMGQYSPEHYKLIHSRNPHNKKKYNFFAIGEVIMSREAFEKNKLREDGTEFRNPRNLVAGKINDKKPNEILMHCNYIRYGLHSDDEAFQTSKSSQLAFLNQLNPISVKYHTCLASNITEELLKDLFDKWNKEYEIDGVIIEVDSYELREKLGRETSTNNPCYARAYKGDFEDVAETLVIGITGQITKQGFIAPVLQINPVSLNGATVSNVFADNAKYVVENGIGIGSVVKVKRSGMVIPRIVQVVKQAKQTYLPTECPTCNSELEWNETKVQLCCINELCEAQILQKNIAFFEIIGVDNMGEGVCEQLFNAGYDSVRKILNMSKEDMQNLPGFGERKSEIVYNNIQKAITDIPLSRLQHASGCFKNLGSKKLELLTWANEKTTVNEIVAIDGFSEILANNYLEGIKKYNKFVDGLPVKVKKQSDKPNVVSDKCKNWNVVFTGFTNKEMEKTIVENGGIIGSGVSKKTTHLVMKQKGSGSSKEVKAQELNVPIYDASEFALLLLKL